jgi:hypothetical protein
MALRNLTSFCGWPYLTPHLCNAAENSAIRHHHYICYVSACLASQHSYCCLYMTALSSVAACCNTVTPLGSRSEKRGHT